MDAQYYMQKAKDLDFRPEVKHQYTFINVHKRGEQGKLSNNYSKRLNENSTEYCKGN